MVMIGLVFWSWGYCDDLEQKAGSLMIFLLYIYTFYDRAFSFLFSLARKMRVAHTYTNYDNVHDLSLRLCVLPSSSLAKSDGQFL